MTVEDYLIKKGFQYKTTTNQKGRQALMECPKCGDKTSFGISLDTGAYNCFRANKCGIQGSFTDFQRMFGDNPIYLDSDRFVKIEKKYDTPNIKPKPINHEIIEYFKNRGIQEETIKKFRLGYLDGCILFPYHKDGKLVNVKYRNLEEKKFRKEKNCMSTLWNQDNISSENLLICEGEIDAMSFNEWELEAVSIPSGVNDTSWIENDWDFLQRFDVIYLCMDNDTAGQSIIDNLVNRLGKWRCRNVLLPCKDANECLMKGMDKSEIENIIRNSQSFDLAELKSCKNYIGEIIDYKNNPDKLNGTVTSNLGLTEIIKGWRNEELSIWTGSNGSGKSTFLSQEIIHLIKSGKKVCIGSFEMPPRKYLWWFLKQYKGENQLTDEDIQSILQYNASNLLIIDLVGNIEKDKLFEIMEFAFRKYGADVFVIDSLMKVDLTSEQNKIYGEQKKFTSELKDFCNKFKSHIHLVAHPRKGENDDQMRGKSDVAGSADITNLADNVFVLHRFSDEQKEKREKANKEPYDSMLIVKKNREHGVLGSIGFYFDSYSKRFLSEDKQLGF